MPRVIVTTDAHRPDPAASILLDEQVASIHLGDGHAAAQLVERLAWAINDAEEAQRRDPIPVAVRPSPHSARSARTRAGGRRGRALAA
jgi:hypothetical protein